MLKIFIVDKTAESRNRLLNKINELVRADLADLDIMPRLTLKPLSPQELKFNALPDVCIIGEQLLTEDLTHLGEIKKLVQSAALLVKIGPSLNNIAAIEQLARFGADDVITDDITAKDLIRKIILLTRRIGTKKPGQLIVVDSAKGGTGVTTICAALGEAIAATGRRVALLDFDFDTQDLSRFLQARPFVNENLLSMLENERAITQEFVEQCLIKVWEDTELYCMPPVADSDQIYDSRSGYSRGFVSVLELLDSEFDTVIVDSGAARGSLLKALYRAADKVVLVVNNDPATLYSAVDKVSKIKAHTPGAGLIVVDNASSKNGLPNSLLRSEFNRAAKITDDAWLETSIPFCKEGSRWPGSGSTLLSQGKNTLEKAFGNLVLKLSGKATELGEETAASKTLFFGWIRSRAKKHKINQASLPEPTKLAGLSAPAPMHSEGVHLVREPLPELPSPQDLIHPAAEISAKNGSYSSEANELAELDIDALVSGAKVA